MSYWSKQRSLSLIDNQASTSLGLHTIRNRQVNLLIQNNPPPHLPPKRYLYK
ncbi:hypothetical protein DN38_3303 [Vibrio cholerae]|nr:hypothetical protein DN38_3303 [Vibrio cholerae]